MKQGKLIVIEGCEEIGKETQSKLLVESLLKRNIPAIEFSFPNYESPTGKIFRDCVLGKNGNSYFQEGYQKIDPKVVCLYTAADRKYNLKEINQYLERGYVVVLNRYTSSNMANQGSKISDSNERFYMYQWIDRLEYWLLQLPKPDQTILLKVPLSFFASENQKRTAEAYQELSEIYNWNVIECVEDARRKTIEEVHQEILKFCEF